MAIDTSSAKAMYKEMLRHVGHDIECATYGLTFRSNQDNVAIECLTCNEVLFDVDKE